MLPKEKRIPRKIFSELLKERHYANSEHFTLRFCVSKDLLSTEATRIGVTVSKKISKSAVIRNKTRRRVYSAVRPLISSLPKGLFLIVAKGGAEKMHGDVLTSELRELFGRIRT